MGVSCSAATLFARFVHRSHWLRDQVSTSAYAINTKSTISSPRRCMVVLTTFALNTANCQHHHSKTQIIRIERSRDYLLLSYPEAPFIFPMAQPALLARGNLCGCSSVILPPFRLSVAEEKKSAVKSGSWVIFPSSVFPVRSCHQKPPTKAALGISFLPSLS